MSSVLYKNFYKKRADDIRPYNFKYYFSPHPSFAFGEIHLPQREGLNCVEKPCDGVPGSAGKGAVAFFAFFAFMDIFYRVSGGFIVNSV